ncbi:hypothetical protein INT45_010101 [Circinella minor]|uniref:Zn(2)-C6 fungal-type domain-containing protein n=1 Tax=Circinella minor TaxID=1195481 RepID=A0A8H7SB78_9FUNG|nr:hypothetical protein INT45_010101 [Circinella minor]
MRNERPCSACRILRKKCVWLKHSDICDRCVKHNTECISIDVYEGTEHGEPVSQDGNHDVQNWWGDMKKVDAEMEQMQSFIRTTLQTFPPSIFEQEAVDFSPQYTTFPTSNGNQITTFSAAMTTTSNNGNSSTSSPCSINISLSPGMTDIDTPISTYSIDDDEGIQRSNDKRMIKNDPNLIEPEWQLTIVNGHMRLLSTIRTIDELEMYTQAALRYLSPFTAVFETEWIQFDSSSISIALGSKKFIQRNTSKKPRKKFNIIGFENNNNSILDYGENADKLINHYLMSYNEITGLLHAPTFRKYYESLDNPLTDALSLAVCVDAVVSVRGDLGYTPMEKRHLADYFYTQCKDLLFDMFDDPTCKLKAVMTTTLLQRYLMEMVMDCFEARRLATVALLICVDLDILYIKEKMETVERVIYQRHRLYLEIYNQTFDMLLEDKVDFTATASIHLTTLDDEPEKTKEYVALCNHVFRFAGSTYHMNLMRRINCLVYGKSSSLRLNDILRFEPVVREWYASIPEKYRLCDDPFVPNAYQFIEKYGSTTNMLPFASLHMTTAVVTSSILQPRLQKDSAAFGVLRLIRERAASLAITSLSFEALMQVLYALDKLTSCSNIEFPLDLRTLLHDCFKDVSRHLPTDHQVPMSSTRLESYLKDPKNYPLDIYEQYPLPGVALLYDIFLTSITQLDRRLEKYNRKRSDGV